MGYTVKKLPVVRNGTVATINGIIETENDHIAVVRAEEDGELYEFIIDAVKPYIVHVDFRTLSIFPQIDFGTPLAVALARMPILQIFRDPPHLHANPEINFLWPQLQPRQPG